MNIFIAGIVIAFAVIGLFQTLNDALIRWKVPFMTRNVWRKLTKANLEIDRLKKLLEDRAKDPE